MLPYRAGKAEAKGLAKVAGHRTDFVAKLLRELELNRVISRRPGDRRIYSRRLVREELERKRTREWHQSKSREKTVNATTDLGGLSREFHSHSSSSSSSSSSKLTEREELARALFEKFWIDYPKKLDHDEVLRLWLSLSPIDQTVAAESVIVWVKSEEWSEARFVPSPENFLRKRRWESRPTLQAAKESPNDRLKRLEAKARGAG